MCVLLRDVSKTGQVSLGMFYVVCMCFVCVLCVCMCFVYVLFYTHTLSLSLTHTQASPIYGSWRHAAAMRGVPSLTATLGAGLNDAAAGSCMYKEGAHDRDRILNQGVYKDAYTLSFNYAAVLTQTSEVSDDAELIAVAERGAVLNGSALDQSSAAVRTRGRRGGSVLGAGYDAGWMGVAVGAVAAALHTYILYTHA